MILIHSSIPYRLYEQPTRKKQLKSWFPSPISKHTQIQTFDYFYKNIKQRILMPGLASF